MSKRSCKELLVTVALQVGVSVPAAERECLTSGRRSVLRNGEALAMARMPPNMVATLGPANYGEALRNDAANTIISSEKVKIVSRPEVAGVFIVVRRRHCLR